MSRIYVLMVRVILNLKSPWIQVNTIFKQFVIVFKVLRVGGGEGRERGDK